MKRRTFLKAVPAVLLAGDASGAEEKSPNAKKEPIMTPDGPYKPTRKSLDANPFPEWFDDATLGMFIDWGLYSHGRLAICASGKWT